MRERQTDRRTDNERSERQFRAIYMESGGGRAKTSLEEEDDDRIEGRAAKTLVFLLGSDDPRSDSERNRDCIVSRGGNAAE